jgi:hypothetical protein
MDNILNEAGQIKELDYLIKECGDNEKLVKILYKEIEELTSQVVDLVIEVARLEDEVICAELESDDEWD